MCQCSYIFTGHYFFRLPTVSMSKTIMGRLFSLTEVAVKIHYFQTALQYLIVGDIVKIS